jgi:hypothetical protein
MITIVTGFAKMIMIVITTQDCRMVVKNLDLDLNFLQVNIKKFVLKIFFVPMRLILKKKKNTHFSRRFGSSRQFWPKPSGNNSRWFGKTVQNWLWTVWEK